MRGPIQKDTAKSKAPYEPPALVILGTVAELTQAKGQGGADRGANSA